MEMNLLPLLSLAVKVAEQAVPLLIAPWGEDAMVLRGRFVVRAAASQVFLIMP